jgi:hypothetical protein
MVKEQITNTKVIPSMASADDGYSSQEGLEEVLGLGVKVVSMSGAKGKKIIEARQWKSQPYRQARAERSAIESLLFTLKEGFEFGELVRRTHEQLSPIPIGPRGMPQRQRLLGVVNWVFLGHRIVEEEYQGRAWLGCCVRAIARYLSGHLAGPLLPRVLFARSS